MLEMRWNFCREDSIVLQSTGRSPYHVLDLCLKSITRSVVQPPPDQRNYTRLGVFYFCMTDDAVKLMPRSESPVLQKVGVVRRFNDADAPTMEAWRKGRTTAYGTSKLATGKEAGVEEEIINGVLVKHYN